MEIDFTILTDKERQVYFLREEGHTFKEIAKEVGISSKTASKYYYKALRILELAEWYQKKTEKFSEMANFPLTNGEIAVIYDALLIFEKVYYDRNRRKPANKYQEQYIKTRESIFKDLKKRVMINTFGEENYKMISDVYK